MSEPIVATSGDVQLEVILDFEAHRWSSASVAPEGEFPFTVHMNGKRYEVYSDGTFAEVEGGAD
jgi:hypothetical protein